MKKKLLKTSLLTYSMLSVCSLANASVISIDDIDATWTNVSGSSSVSGVGTNEIRWGTPLDDEQSGYRFDTASTDSFLVELNEEFSLGEFTHYNFPIYASGGSIDWAELNVSTNISIDGVNRNEGPFSFSFFHDETPNACSPQPECANDLVNFGNSSASDTFLVDDVEYTMALTGFVQNGVFTNNFSTLEKNINVADLRAVFTQAEVASVPEPSAMALIGLGLLGLVGFGKSKQ